MLTSEQVYDQTKDVTRRVGWKFLMAGDVLQAVEKARGLGEGGKVKRICRIVVVDASREPLRAMLDDLDYGQVECAREGFPPPHEKSDPAQFVEFFCLSHKGVTPETEITRIEFSYDVEP